MTDLENLYEAASGMLAAQVASDKLALTQEAIRKCIAQLRPSFPNVTEEEANQLAIRFEQIHVVSMRDPIALQASGFEPWLEDAQTGIDPFYWNRYRRLLRGRDFSLQVLAKLDSATDRILGYLENPARQGEWDRRGMVVGHVQSGKTANYIGLVCKAADAGYKVIVIIAGIHNNLRNQTQQRVDEGFVGFASASSLRSKMVPSRERVGVGLIDARRRPNVFTAARKDFHKEIADAVGIPLQNLDKEPAVFVIKKNTSTLKNLIDWLTAHNAQYGTARVLQPMLLIDDEADNASINIRQRQDEVSRINMQIRQLLNLFDRSCYVGYTATPFANIFIDPDTDDEMVGDDLFPRDFIVSLDSPDNYFGASKVFGDDAVGIVWPVDGKDNVLPLKHRIDHPVEGLPKTLETAVRVFLLARAIRLARKQIDHNSMLVNASRFIRVQSQIRDEIHAFVDRIGSSVRVNGALPPGQALRDPEIAKLHKAFESHYASTCGVSWPEVQALLHDSVSRVKVEEVNSRAPGSLDYVAHDKGLNVIAVGGFSLSRGLTLEGLVVSYFHRNSLMYDTLLQMGRWFGYRIGYEDLCRVWMLEEAEGWYTHIAESIEELRDDFARMESENATPREFGLRVRSHPDSLVVTARNKIGTGKRLLVQVGLGTRFIETDTLRYDSETLEANRRAAISLAEDLRRCECAPKHEEDSESGNWFASNAPVSVVKSFLLAFRNHDEASLKTQTTPILNYIENRINELSEWDILFPSLKKKRRSQDPSDQSLVDSSLGFQLICQRRSSPVFRSGPSGEKILQVTSKRRVSSRGIAKAGLSKEQLQEAHDYYDKRHAKDSNRKNYPDWLYGKFRKKPLLVVHLVDIRSDSADLSRGRPVAAWSISFPRTEHDDKKVEYVVNTPWQREFCFDTDEDAHDDE